MQLIPKARALSRRQMLKQGAAVATICGAPMLAARAGEFTNEPTGDNVTFGFSIANSGAFADEGADQLRAFELAVKHLNGEGDGGMLNTMQPSLLQGNGVLGKRVNYVTVDTETKASVATRAAEAMIDGDGVIMISGGSSSGVAFALQDVCTEKGVLFMTGLAAANGLTGENKSAFGFRHCLNAQMSSQALASALVDNLGTQRSAYYLTADYSWGWDNENAIKQATEALGWTTVATVRTPVGTSNFSQYLTPILASGADVLIMPQYGKDMVNVLSQASELGLKNLQINGNNFELAIPLYSQLMAQAAGDACTGVYGTINWLSTGQDAGSLAFTNSFETEYGFPPSAAAHTCYVQTLQYADAVERAGTFEPCQVIAELEGHKFDGAGNGNCEYRSTDHQCFKDVLVVAGKAAAVGQYDRLGVTNVITKAQVEYSAAQNPFAVDASDSCSKGTTEANTENNIGGSTTGDSGDSDTDTTSKSNSGGSTSIATVAALTTFAAAKLTSSNQ